MHIYLSNIISLFLKQLKINFNVLLPVMFNTAIRFLQQNIILLKQIKCVIFEGNI